MTRSTRPLIRTSVGRVAVAATAALAAVVTTAPTALAEDDVAPDSGEVTPDATSESRSDAQPKPDADPEPDVDPAPESIETNLEPVVDEAAEDGARVAAAEEIEEDEPAYGSRRYFLSVEGDPDGWTPPDSTTVGSTFTMVTTHLDGTTSTDYCTTVEPTAPRPNDFSTCDEDGYAVGPGDTVDITQTGAGPGYQNLDQTSSVEPCTTEVGASEPCSLDGGSTYINSGPPPEAPAQSETVEAGGSVTMDPVGELTEPFDPDTEITAVDNPSFGTAALVDGKIVYTANEDAGDSAEVFSYTMSNSNGSTTGSVSVTIEAAEVLEPDYGTRKYYVDVEQGYPSWVAPGSSTSGSTFSVVLTHPDGTTSTDSCVSGPIPMDSLGVSSTCNFPFGLEAGEGDDIAVTQTGAGTGFASDGETKYIDACSDEEVVEGTCEPGGVTFENKGFKPVTVADPDEETPAATPVTIDVLANDTSADPTTLELDVVSGPADGSAVPVGSPNLTSPSPFPLAASSDRVTTQVVPAKGTYAIRYTPDPGFSGTDTFAYTVENSNGTSERATVTVQVVGGVPVDPDDGGSTDDPDDLSTPRASTPTRATLPDTGAPTGRYLGLGALLVAIGSALVSRRRREELVRD